MAQSSIKRMLREMYKASNAKYMRKELDKQGTKVLVTTYNIQQGIKHGYALAQKKKGNLPFIDDSVFLKAAKFAMRALQNHLKRPSKAHGIRFRSRNLVLFTQESGTNTDPFRVIKETAQRYIESHVDRPFDDQEKDSFDQGLSRQHTRVTVGLQQYARSLQKLSRTKKFGGFASSYEAKRLSDMYNLDLYFESSGRGTRKKFTIKESVSVGLLLKASSENPPGDAPTDWKNIAPELEKAILDFAARQPWYTMPGSASLADDHSDLVLDSVMAEITEGKYVRAGKKVRRRKAKDKRVTVNKPLTNKLKRSTKTADSLKGQESQNNIHNLIFMINARLHDTLYDNMTSPRLVYRTGEFARSVTANATTTAKGNLSIGYDYQKNPYAVFAPGGKMYTPQRNPQTLIEGSIREIALELAIGRYGIRRT